jgi:cell division protein FtsZ
MVLGVGSSGARAVAHMGRIEPALNTLIVDTDLKELQAIQSERAIQVGRSVTDGFSAGGDVELGRQSIERDSSEIRQQLKQADLLIVVAGLGGGTGSGAMPVITRLGREAGTLVMGVVTLPFAFEGKAIAGKADEALKRIRTHADAIVRIPNEMLLDRSDADIPAVDAFALSHQVVTEGIFAFIRMLLKPGVCGIDFASIHTMLRNCDGFCHFAGAETEGPDRAAKVGDEIAKHRLLNRGRILRKAAGVVVGITGGEDLRLSEIETVMGCIQEPLQEDAWINYGVVIDGAFKERISVIVLVAEQWKEPLVDAANRQMGFTFSHRLAQEQGELPLETAGKGRFTNLDPTVHKNQDLDVPAYLRRGIKLPR